jgi:uncharacterized RDD family membrane protein YckC
MGLLRDKHDLYVAPTMESQSATEAAPIAPAAAAPVASAPSSDILRLGDVAVASTGKRVGALLLDGLLAVCLLGIGYMIWMLLLWRNGQTPGKKLLGLQVRSTETGEIAGFGTMALREIIGKSMLGSITFGITYLVSIFTILGATHQGVWDKVAKTQVVEV